MANETLLKFFINYPSFSLLKYPNQVFMNDIWHSPSKVGVQDAYVAYDPIHIFHMYDNGNLNSRKW